MALTTATIAGFDLSGSVEAYDLPTAKLSDDGLAAQDAGLIPSASDYLDAPFSLTLIIRAADADAVKDAVSAMTRRFRSGSALSWGEDGSPALSSAVQRCEVASEAYFGTWARITYSGTREPFWTDAWKPLTSTAVPLWGTADITESIDGDVEAEVALVATCSQASEWVALGCKHDPAADYDPTDDYSGASDANAYGGETTNAVTVTTDTALGTAPTLDSEANRGLHLPCARLKNSTGSVSLKVASAASSTVYADEPAVSFSQTALRGVSLGRVRVPVSEVPNTSGGTVYLTATRVVNQDTGTTEIPSGTFTQTYTAVDTGRVPTIEIYGRGAVGVTTASVSLLDPSHLVFGEPTTVGKYRCSTVSTTAGWHVFTRDSGNGEIVAGTQYQVSGSVTTYNFIPSRSTSSTYAGGSCSAGGDLRFRVWEEERVSFGTTTPLKATGSGTATLDVLTRIPLDDFAVVVDSTAAASDGFAFEGGDVFTRYAAGTTGTSILGTEAQVYGKHLGLAPGVTNRLVAAADTTATAAPGTLTVTGNYRQRWLTLSKGA